MPAGHPRLRAETRYPRLTCMATPACRHDPWKSIRWPDPVLLSV